MRYDLHMGTTDIDTRHAALPPSPWVTRFAVQIPSGTTVLDVACGAGRHAKWLAGRGLSVDAVDRDIELFADPPPRVTLIQADLEAAPWPFAGLRYGAVVVTNYLHRPLLPMMIDALIEGGILIYETFARGNEAYGRPTRAEFLLQRGELLEAVRGRCDVVAYEDTYVDEPKPAVVQRIAAIRR